MQESDMAGFQAEPGGYTDARKASGIYLAIAYHHPWSKEQTV